MEDGKCSYYRGAKMRGFLSAMMSSLQSWISSENARIKRSDSGSKPQSTSASSGRKSCCGDETMISEVCYLIYRTPIDEAPNWDSPTGGIVVPIGDIYWGLSIGYQRYHIGPHEKLWFCEVTDPGRKALAKFYHKRWEREMNEWMEGAEA